MSTFDKPFPSRRSLAFRLCLALGLAGGFLALSSSASARQNFPGLAQKELGMVCAPPCTVCHTSPAGGFETAIQPFADNLHSVSPTVDDTNFIQVLRVVENEVCRNLDDPGCKPDTTGTKCTGFCDADADGVNDVAQLAKGLDPNTGQALFCVKYGCGAHVAPTPPSRSFDGTAVFAAFGALVVLSRRLRRGRR